MCFLFAYELMMWCKLGISHDVRLPNSNIMCVHAFMYTNIQNFSHKKKKEKRKRYTKFCVYLAKLKLPSTNYLFYLGLMIWFRLNRLVGVQNTLSSNSLIL